MAGKGGKTPGAGRKPKAITDLTKNFAARILSDQLEGSRWLQMLDSDDPRVVIDALKFLGNHKHGMPKQTVDAKIDAEVSLVEVIARARKRVDG